MAHQTGGAWRPGTSSRHGGGFRPSAFRHGALALAALTALTVVTVGCAGTTSHSASHNAARPATGEAGPLGSYGSGGALQAPHKASQGTGPVTLDARAGVIGGALFGGDTPLLTEQGQLRRRLAIVRDYYRIGEKFPDSFDKQAMASGSTVLASLDTVLGQGPTYASIAAGRQDSAIRSFLIAMNQTAVDYHLGAIYVSFQHEANDAALAPLGSPAEFVQAWDHVHQLAASAHLDWNQGGRLHWVWILSYPAFLPVGGRALWQTRMGLASSYWPGAGEVDIVAADGYNSIGCAAPGGPGTGTTTRAPATPAGLFGSAVNFAQAYGGLPVFIAEWGSTAFTAGSQPTFIQQMQSYIASTPAIAAAMYWDGPQYGSGHTGCGLAFQVNNHPAAVAALATMGQSAALQGRVAATPLSG